MAHLDQTVAQVDPNVQNLPLLMSETQRFMIACPYATVIGKKLAVFPR